VDERVCHDDQRVLKREIDEECRENGSGSETGPRRMAVGGHIIIALAFAVGHPDENKGGWRSKWPGQFGGSAVVEGHVRVPYVLLFVAGQSC
jgi:hypothetical protein